MAKDVEKVPQHPDPAAALTDAAEALSRTATADETLTAIVTVALATLDDVDHVGVTLVHRDGRLETAAATDPFVHELDEIQYALNQGPCVSALESGAEPVTVVEHARHESRWHDFIPRAVRLGLTAQLGVRMFANDRTVGVLNLYATSSETISQDTRHLAELFATHAALAYGHSRQVDNLRIAITTRQLIGQAVGIVMERFGLDDDRAFQYLIRLSSDREVKLRDVASEVVASAGAGLGPSTPTDAPSR